MDVIIRIRIRRFLTTIWRSLKNIVFIELGIFATVGLICWLGGWRTLYQYGNGLMLAGVAILALGVYSNNGSRNIGRAFDYQYAASAGMDDAHQSVNREREDARASYAFMGLMFVVALVPIVVGILMQMVFGFGQ